MLPFMLGMNGECITVVDGLSAAEEAHVAQTWPPMSQNRFNGVVWYETMMSRARTASNDCARFAAGLEGE